MVYLKQQKFVRYRFIDDAVEVIPLTQNDKFIQQIPSSLRNNITLLFFVFYAKQKFKNLREIDAYLINNGLLRDMGLNLQLITKLIIYVSFITGEQLLEMSEFGVSLEAVEEEKLLFLTKESSKSY